MAAQFTSEGATLSGLDLELLGGGYRMSLVKRRFATGSCCPLGLEKQGGVGSREGELMQAPTLFYPHRDVPCQLLRFLVLGTACSPASAGSPRLDSVDRNTHFSLAQPTPPSTSRPWPLVFFK